MAIQFLRRGWQRGALLSLWMVLGCLTVGWADTPSLTLVWSKGTVSVRRAGTAMYVPATERMALMPGDIVRTEANAEAVIGLPSGARWKLPANTVQAIPSFRREDGPRRTGWEQGPGSRPMGPGSGDRARMGGPNGWKPFSGAPPRSPGSDPSGKLSGSVMVRRSGAGMFVPLAPEATLNPGDMVRTGYRSSVALRFADGSQVRLRENTCLIVPPAAGRTVVVGLQIGDSREPGSPSREGVRMKPHPGGDFAPPGGRAEGGARAFPRFGPGGTDGGAPFRPDGDAVSVTSREAGISRVLVRRSGTRLFVPVTPETVLGPGDLIRTSPNGGVTLHFGDGSQSRLKGNCWLLIPPSAGRTVVSELRADRAP